MSTLNERPQWSVEMTVPLRKEQSSNRLKRKPKRSDSQGSISFEQLRKAGNYRSTLNVLRLEESLFSPEQLYPNIQEIIATGNYPAELQAVTVAGSIHCVNQRNVFCSHHDRYADTIFVEVEALATELEFDPVLKGVNGGRALTSAVLWLPCQEPTRVVPKTGPQSGHTKLVSAFSHIEPIMTEAGEVVRGLGGSGDPIYFLSGWYVTGAYQPKCVVAPSGLQGVQEERDEEEAFEYSTVE